MELGYHSFLFSMAGAGIGAAVVARRQNGDSERSLLHTCSILWQPDPVQQHGSRSVSSSLVNAHPASNFL